jgi:hypothetical protein
MKSSIIPYFSAMLVDVTMAAQDASLDIAKRSDERIANEGREVQVPSIASLIGGAEFKKQSSQRRVAQWRRRVLSRILADTLFRFLRKPYRSFPFLLDQCDFKPFSQHMIPA